MIIKVFNFCFRWRSRAVRTQNFPSTKQDISIWGKEKERKGEKKQTKKNSEIDAEMFSQDGRKKQTRNLKAKPAVSTLKTVHSNYFPVGVSTFLPVCSEKSCRFNCREFSHFHTQPMFSVALMFCQTIITSCLLFQCKTRQGSNDVQFCRRDAVHKPTAGVHGPGKPARSH